MMKSLLKSEELAMALVAIYFLYLHDLGLPVWIWILLFFSPDVSMFGYIFGNKAGAICYNVFHHKGVALIIAFAGYLQSNELVMVIGILLFGHSSLDRVLGYGLKYFSGFKHTHLGNL